MSKQGYEKLADSVSKTFDSMYEGVDPVDMGKRLVEGDLERQKKKMETNYWEGDFFVRVLDDGSLVIMGYNGDAKDVVIPSIISGKKVNTIGAESFKRKKIRSLTISEGVKRIGMQAFDGCTELTDITILGSDLVIIVPTFSGCSNLKTVKLSIYSDIIMEEYVTKNTLKGDPWVRTKITDRNIHKIWAGVSKFSYIESEEEIKQWVKNQEERKKTEKEADPQAKEKKRARFGLVLQIGLMIAFFCLLNSISMINKGKPNILTLIIFSSFSLVFGGISILFRKSALDYSSLTLFNNIQSWGVVFLLIMSIITIIAMPFDGKGISILLFIIMAIPSRTITLNSTSMDPIIKWIISFFIIIGIITAISRNPGWGYLSVLAIPGSIIVFITELR